MTKFTAIAATLLATAGASVASAQVADPVTGTVDATAETRVDTGPVIDGTTDTADRALMTAEERAQAVEDRLDSTTDTTMERADEASDVDADLETLAQAGMTSGFAAVMVLALYINSPEVLTHYNIPWLVWPLCPILLYIIVRIWVLARRGHMHDDPVVFMLQDWRSQMMIAVGGLMFLLAAYA